MSQNCGKEQRELSAHNVLSGNAAESVVQAGSIRDVHFHSPGRVRHVPFQLPAAPGLFASRERELACLEQWHVDESVRPALIVLSGPGGVGKTSLALRWLHAVRHDYFPDGQLYVDLGGFSETGPVDPEEALAWFLHALGVPSEEVPPDLPRRQALFRSTTADRALVLLLDNAVSAAQVRQLLPSSPHSAVVVTSRWRLTGLGMDGARIVDVDPLDASESLQVLERAIGAHRLSAEPDAVRELAGLCGGLPIALSLVGARLSSRPRRSLSKEVTVLRDADRRLRSLSLEEGTSVEGIFDVTCSELDARHARAYRLCALHPGAEFGTAVAAVALGEPESETEGLLEDLVEKNLLTEVADGRFKYHDLLRLHARRWADESGADDRDTALVRMIRFYLRTAVAATTTVLPLRPGRGSHHEQSSAPHVDFPHGGAALSWLEAERANLMSALRTAAEHEWHELAWQLCDSMWALFLFRHHYPDWIEAHRIAITSADRLGDAVPRAALRNQSGFGLANLGRYDEARAVLSEALRIADESEDLQNRATALSHLGKVDHGVQDLERALTHYRLALECEERLGRRRGVALAHRRIAEVLLAEDRWQEAVTSLRSAETIFTELADEVQRGRVLTRLGAAHLGAGRPQDAERVLTTALALVSAAGAPSYVAEVRLLLGEIARDRGDLSSARAHFTNALHASERFDPSLADRARAGVRSLE
jgi:tetratricopeptide (TPR) repeat protein